jgi:UDP-glucuronate 4-epimerase
MLMKKILVTGAAGFIAYSLVKQLIAQGSYSIVGLDNINDYYDVNLKYGRLQQLGIARESIVDAELCTSTLSTNFRFIKLDLQARAELNELMEKEQFDTVCNLAAQAGVRYSIDHPFAYVESNLVGFMNLLEASRQCAIKHFVFASSSSVYGMSNRVPYSESQQVDNPISLYAATKKSNELMAHSYSKLYQLPTTGIRFFTVYGPWGRPDMAPYLFMDAIEQNRTIKVFNHGNLERDFTYIDDIVQGLISVIGSPASASEIPYDIYNLGNSSPVKLMDFIGAMERVTGHQTQKEYCEMQAGDVYQTYADMTKFEARYGYKPQVGIEQGLRWMYEWYKSFK